MREYYFKMAEYLFDLANGKTELDADYLKAIASKLQELGLEHPEEKVTSGETNADENTDPPGVEVPTKPPPPAP